ncbi:MAG: AAA family ATPase, partial [Candidatus Omnitrophica bacterium]|nr:AAA family ATPase [Candidatus Omnitrophota bacterium]
LRNALAQISAQLHTAQARAARLETELSRVAQERSVLQAQTQEIEQAFKAGRARDLELSRCLNDQKIAFEEARMRTEESDRGLREAQQILVVLQSRYEILQGLAASHEGYSAGVRHLLESLQQGTLDRAGVTGVLAHLIRVEPGYEMAVEAALGDLAQAVVVENWETAARCLDHLQAANAGRATFLVSSAAAAANGSRTMTLRPSTSGNQKNSAEGPHEPVASQVHVAAELESLVDSLLGHAYLARDLGTALELTQTAIVPLCFVTPQGERVEVPLVTGGGSLSTDNMLVGRRQRLAQVQADLENVRQRVASAENQETTARSAQDSLEAALDGLEKEVQDHRKILAQHETQHASLSAQLRQLTDENAVLESEFSLARQQHDQAREQESLAGRALAEAEEQSAQWQMQITQAQETLAQASREREVYVVQAAQVQAQLSTLDEVRSSREQSLKLMEQSLGSMQDSIRAREGEFEALVSREQELTDQRAQFEREIAARAQAQCTDEQTLEQVIGERNAMAQSISGEASGLHALETERDAVRLQKHEIELNLNQLSYQRQALADRLSQVYQLVLDPAAGFPQDPQDQDWEKLTADCDVLRKRMEGIGAVSMSSLDENQELQDRLQFLTQQQADLMKAKDDLHEAITKINRTTRAQFKETFQKIQQEFQTTFKTLFGGGEARLVLMDEEDILESGIEIIARPPGKTLQSISLLSGGEKALTSVALLFSIFRVKPSPFCLLDEIDAPLDEANVDRFTKALKEFLKDSQFIIITHNKKTIVMADVMYGITMEEHGVSKIVSVKFQDRSVSSQTAPAALSDLSQAAAAEPAAPPAP